MIKAVIFDMDGVLSDTEGLHAQVKKIILENCFSVQLSEEEITERYAGMMEAVMFRAVAKEYGIGASEEKIQSAVERKWEMTYQILQETPVSPIPGAIELVRYCFVKGFKIGVASGAPLSFIDYIVKSLDIRDCFQNITSTQEVARGKPAPDVFLLCASRLKIDAKDCLVIEDSRNGMMAAVAAGMTCVGLVSDTEVEYPTKYLVNRLENVTSFLSTPMRQVV